MTIKEIIEGSLAVLPPDSLKKVRAVAIDFEGNMHGFSTTPERVQGAEVWGGLGKALLSIVARGVDGWHNTYYCMELKQMCSYNVSVKPAEVGATDYFAGITKRWPERSFVDHPEQYGLASAYCSKAQDAKKRNIRFELSFEEFSELFSRDVCAISGNKLGRFGRPHGMDQASLERVDPSKGYTSRNCIIIAADLNEAKSGIDRLLLSSHDPEHLLKIFYKAENVLRQRIKAKQKQEKENAAPKGERLAEFENRFPILKAK